MKGKRRGEGGRRRAGREMGKVKRGRGEGKRDKGVNWCGMMRNGVDRGSRIGAMGQGSEEGMVLYAG